MVVGTDCVSQYKSNKDTMKAKKALLMISIFFQFPWWYLIRRGNGADLYIFVTTFLITVSYCMIVLLYKHYYIMTINIRTLAK